MRVTLVHNPKAGHSSYSETELVSLLRAGGYDPTYFAVENNVASALETTEALVAVAGGDGTVREAAKALRGRPVHLAVLPQGTANNIAQTLGWDGTPEEIVGGWKKADFISVDAGIAAGPWGESIFFESAGMGLLAEGMPQLSAHKKQLLQTFGSTREELHFDAQGLREVLAEFPARPWQILLDGEDISGPYLMVEAMNIGAAGPGLRLAPGADPQDGLLDVVMIPPEMRDLLDQYIASTVNASISPPELPVRRANRLDIQWEGASIHADDEIWPSSGQWRDWEHPAPHEVRFSLHGRAVTFLSNRHSPARERV